MARPLRSLASHAHPTTLPVSSRHSLLGYQSYIRPRKLDLRPFIRLGTTMTENHRIEYNWIKSVEKLEEYQPGGYHPIMVGEVLHDRYHIVDKLGFRGYSTVWLARDTHLNRYVAVKVNIADSNPRDRKILKALSASSLTSLPVHLGHNSIPVFQDEFKVQGPNGKHTCYTVTPAQCNLREISFSRLFPFEVARAMSYRLTQAVAYTHSKGYVHGDIHLSNILVKLPLSLDELSINQFYESYGEPETIPITRCDGEPLPTNALAKAVVPVFLGKYAENFTLSDAHLLLSDFGEAFSPTLDAPIGQNCRTPPAFRAPEAKFESQIPLSYPSDIWSLATAIWEIIGMKAIFSTDFVDEDEIVSQHIDVVGSMPSEWWQRWEGRPWFFDEDGHPTHSHSENRWPPLEESFETGVQKWRRKIGGEIEQNEISALLYLMCRMLSFRPEERSTAEEVLMSDWMVKWALIDHERS